MPLERQIYDEFGQRRVRDVGKNVGQPRLRIDVVELGGPPSCFASEESARF